MKKTIEFGYGSDMFVTATVFYTHLMEEEGEQPLNDEKVFVDYVDINRVLTSDTDITESVIDNTPLKYSISVTAIEEFKKMTSEETVLSYEL